MGLTYYQRNKEKIKAKSKAYYYQNKEHCLEISSTWSKNNKKRHKESIQTWWRNNKPWLRQDYKEKDQRRFRNRLQTDPTFAFKCKLRELVRSALKRIGQNKPADTQILLGCTWQEAKAHFERLFLPGMSWENRSEWHIDHIKPVSSFTEADMHLMNRIENLQPLWKIDNLRKGAKVLSAVQLVMAAPFATQQ
jgi:hypothetical protein